ncbi:ABC transporter ATP-binding protein [Leuconostoc citreum]|uniref:ABC transporter ATP-binding protein n=1 Tax=Leuconostoc citreum TaxID=33964 RepID=UPI0018884A4F|nr:ABC transporter ATP-binding protein [Leuconostoc citreum]MCT3073073.1 ABC transporter ATP-binding protein [Leuconostoc citreum]MCT3078428.1 ABC transporter ATP-binding protein [Leuconostoc citreum]MCT3080816.1 ABC transporter ATP-binding protein [Leuconostoc citreum]MCT3081885.1 ABC transporter ATP-binding protein [Leuconostoc citreum]QOY96945.1 ABC transporter ATP-binding protein [Leuconostoc citreum]
MASLKLVDVTKVFGEGTNEVVALNRVNFESRQGELTLILGPSGSGKSTLLTIIGGLQSPTSGEVYVNGQLVDVKDVKSSDFFRLKQVGFVLQSHSLVPFLTVKKQFELADRVKKQNNLQTEQFNHYLQILGIDQLLDKYPNQLSGGQSQRVAIARAIYTNPDFILADEPTAALDSDRVKKVGELFKQIATAEDKAVVIVTHDLRLEQFADHVYHIEDGAITQTK